MLIFDQLRREDSRLRLVAIAVLSGLGILLAGLWWVQVVSARDYEESVETQSFRTVRVPAMRGKILDRNGAVLAENRPTYNVSLYLEELRSAFANEYAQNRPVRVITNRLRFWQRWVGFEPVRTQYVKLTKSQLQTLTWESRCRVASNVVRQVSRRLDRPIAWDSSQFQHHYTNRPALPFPVLLNLHPTNVARFEEQSTIPCGVDLEAQYLRVYPHGATAAHVLGRMQRDDSAQKDEDAFFSYWMPDYRGLVGIEWGCDKGLRGLAGTKSLLVNSFGYRQTENVWSPAEPGKNVTLTIDLGVQKAAELALQQAPMIKYNPPVRGAVVVMDVNSGDILAMASSPTLDPNSFIPKLSKEELQRITALNAEKNLATQENYMPGSIFKTVVGLAALEAGLDEKEMIHVAENPAQPGKGHIIVGRSIKDTVPPGDYDFRRSIKLSSNAYFVTNGLRIGAEAIVRLGQKFHLGERTGLATRQEVSGSFPDLQQVRHGWANGDTANLSIGQAPVWTTPLQIAVLTSALANGGKVLWPRLVARIEPQDPSLGEQAVDFPSARVRDEIGVSRRSLAILHEAMLAETEDPDGTGHLVHDVAALPGLRVCGKTGTAQVQNIHNVKTGQITWFASFAPYERPRYAVVVMVEDGKSGGDTCAPVAGPVYAALLERDRMNGRSLAKPF